MFTNHDQAQSSNCQAYAVILSKCGCPECLNQRVFDNKASLSRRRSSHESSRIDHHESRSAPRVRARAPGINRPLNMATQLRQISI